MTVEGKSSSAGPGYHAFVVEFLDRLAERHNTAWQWRKIAASDADGVEECDETGFAVDRDFERLQREMALVHRAICQSALEHFEDENPILLNMPIGFAPDYPDGLYGALSPLGPMSPDQLRWRCGLEEDAELLAAAADYFPWWDNGFGEDFFAGLALHALWMTVPWTTPRHEGDERLYELVVGWGRRAETHESGSRVPSAALVDVETLAGSTLPPTVPDLEGTGYLRRLFRRDTGGGWSLQVPGSCEISLEDDATTTLFGLSDFAVRFSSLTARRTPECVAAPSETGPRSEAIFEQADLSGEVSPPKPGIEDGFVIHAEARVSTDPTTEEVAILTVWYDRSDLQALAENVARSLRHDTWRAGA